MAIMLRLAALEDALNEESWEWLQDNAPGVARAVVTEVERGASPEDVRRMVMRYARRPALAERVGQAAAFLAGARGE